VATVTAPGTVASATRRLVLLTALRWLPVGLVSPVLVLLGQERGLTLTQVGLVVVAYGVVIALLELPTGGLADVVGRRRVMVLGSLLHLASCTVLALAEGVSGFVTGVLLMSLGRALDSGPLEAWYVDTVHGLDAGADVTPGLSWQGAADAAGCAAGAALGGLLAALAPPGGALLVPVVAAAALDLAHLAALMPLVHEQPRPSGRLGLREVPTTVTTAVRLAVHDQPLRLVLVLTSLGGVALAGLELLGPVRAAEIAGSPDDGAALFGVVLAASFAAGTLGSVAAPRVRRAAGSTRAAAAGLAVTGAFAVGSLAGLEHAVLVGGAFAVFYAAHGCGWPLLAAVSHSRVTAAHRATAVSAVSLALAVGGVVGSLTLPAIAERTSVGTGFASAAGVLVVAALLSLRLRSEPEEPLLDQPLHDGQDLLGGLSVAQPGGGGEHLDELAEPAGAVALGEQRRAVVVDAAGPAQS
jgi:hypothetical protein